MKRRKGAAAAAAAPVAVEDDTAPPNEADTAHPTPVAPAETDAASAAAAPANATSFAPFGLDARLTRALAKAKLVTPTSVQARAIPVALQVRPAMKNPR